MQYFLKNTQFLTNPSMRLVLSAKGRKEEALKPHAIIIIITIVN